MKRILLFIFLISKITIFAQSTSIINDGFENYWNSYDQLQNWDKLQGTGLSKTTNSYEGNFAARLETSFFDGQYNRATVIERSPEPYPAQSPFSNTVDTLTGYYKYIPVGNDSAMVEVLIKTGGTYIGVAQRHLYSASNYTYFEFPFTTGYVLPGDSISIIISSSDPYSATLGSALYVDKLAIKTINTTTDIKTNLLSNNPLAYPNPTTSIVNIVLGTGYNGENTVSVFDINGKLVMQETYNNVTNTISLKVENLQPGVYSYEVSNRNQTVRNKFVKK